MNKNHINTHLLWDVLIRLISLVVFACVCGLIYLPLKPTIDKMLKEPRMSNEELLQLTKERSKLVNEDWDRVENGIHIQTGLAFDENFKYIKSSCLTCHSSRLIIQNRATREGWQDMIQWMQKTQGLQNLGEKETFILDYLAEHYAPKDVGRRPNLELAETEWYILNLD